MFAGSPDADRLSAEALTLGQALDVGAGQLGELLADPRALPRRYPSGGRRRSPTSARARGSPTQAGDNLLLGRALLNLADALMPTDPAAAAEAARTAAGHLRRTGDRRHLAAAIMNVAEALLHAR